MHSTSRSKCVRSLLVAFLIATVNLSANGQRSESIDSSLVAHDAFIAISITPANIYSLGQNRKDKNDKTVESLELIRKACQEQFGVDISQLESVLMTYGPGKPHPKYASIQQQESCMILRFQNSQQAKSLIDKMVGEDSETISIGDKEGIRRPGSPFTFCQMEPNAIAIADEECLAKVLDKDADSREARAMVDQLPLDAEVALVFRQPPDNEMAGAILLHELNSLGIGLPAFIWPAEPQDIEHSITELKSLVVAQRIFEDDSITFEWGLSDSDSAIALVERIEQSMKLADSVFAQMEEELALHRKSVRDSLGPLISATTMLFDHAELESDEATVTLTARRMGGFPEFFDAAVNKLAHIIGVESGILPRPPSSPLDRR